MSNHQASEQMLGYLYQIRYALVLLLENDNANVQISVERFDDVAFSNDGIPIQRIQLKHHITQQGNLSDASTDLWKTLKVWIDVIHDSPEILNETEFFIITTSTAPENSAASYLKRNNNRNTEIAYEKLKTTSQTSANNAHIGYYKAFKNTDVNIIKELINKIVIIDNANDIIDIAELLHKQLRYSCSYKYEDMVCERLEGWWYQKMIEALCSNTPIFVTQREIREKIVSISQEYSTENLPIDIFDSKQLQKDDMGVSERIFREQLKLISSGKNKAKIAIRDYYRAYNQRANWLRNDLIFIEELGKYDYRLIDEWKHLFADMEDELDELAEISNVNIESEKIKKGRQLFSNIENKNIPIRPKCQELFVTRGSYHILASKLQVGWHRDFYERLKNLLN